MRLGCSIGIGLMMFVLGCEKPPPGGVVTYVFGDPRLMPQITRADVPCGEALCTGEEACCIDTAAMTETCGVPTECTGTVIGPGRVVSWATTPWGADSMEMHDPTAQNRWLPYVGHAQLDIEHAVGEVPNGVLVYISFYNDGREPGLAAGDLAQVRSVDDNHVIVWNNTNAAYYARVVLLF